MLLSLTSDQDFFRDTTARFLDDRMPVGEVRRLRDDPQGFTDDYWRQGAELGWTSLLVGAEHGGGSISDHGLVDLTLVAHEIGRHAAPGPLAPTNVVAAALAASPGDHGSVIEGLLSGETVAAWCHAEASPHDHLDEVATTIEARGSSVVITGVKRPVESAGRADHLLVTGRTGDGLSQVLVPAGSPGVHVEALTSVDLTRRFSLVRFDEVEVPAAAVVGELGGADRQIERQLNTSIALTTAEAVGAMQTAFDTTVEWAFDRFSFGRPLASYQALKHRFADMKSWLEAGHAISDAAAEAAAVDAPDATELASAAKAFVSHYGVELGQDCVQIHGGIGVTYEHDLHLYLRRIHLAAALHGSAAEHRRRIADIALARDAA
jgi:alkylation response protein AidB-like acyl-CoA dehydrogenase